VILWLLACAHTFPGPPSALVDRLPRSRTASVRPPAPVHAPPGNPRLATVAAAEGFVGRPRLVVEGTTYRYDCSGLVEAVLAQAGVPHEGSSAMLFADARASHVLHRRRVPEPGDVAFFDDTYDRDRNGRLDDALSHTAIVEAVDPDGTITLIHVGSGGVARFHMNLRHPEDARSPDGKAWNDTLRAHHAEDTRRTRYLAGELWAGFASFWRVDDAGVASTR
jgi:hypothetical protein